MSADRETIPIHSLEQGRAALAAAAAGAADGGEIILESPPAATSWQGVGWWCAVVTLLRAEFPGIPFTAVLDCGNRPGHAMAALRAGVDAIRLEADPEILARIADMAAQQGARLLPPKA